MTTTTITPTTIDLGDLIAFGAEVGPVLADLLDRISDDDEAAYTEANDLLARENVIVEAIVGRFVQLLPACSKWDAEDTIRNAVVELTVTGDVYGAMSHYENRKVQAAVTRHIGAFAMAIQADPDARPFAAVIAEEVIRHAHRLMLVEAGD